MPTLIEVGAAAKKLVEVAVEAVVEAVAVVGEVVEAVVEVAVAADVTDNQNYSEPLRL